MADSRFSLATAFYRVLLRAYPRPFRAEFGEEMERAFAACAARERRRRPRFAAARIAGRAVADTARHACQVRVEARRTRRRARHSFNIALLGPGTPPSRQGLRMPHLLNDLRFALRVLLKNRSYTATVLLTLAICIGANAAIFAIVQSVLLRPLPVPEADRLVNIFNSYPNAGVARASNGVPDYVDRLQGMPCMEELALYRRASATVGFDDGAERLPAVQATPSLFRLLRARAALGNIFQEADAQLGNHLKVIVSQGLWQTRFGSRPDIVGQQMRINGVQRTIVGVMPADFQFLWADINLWTPLAFAPEEKSDERRHSNNYQMVGRLKPGASVEQAREQLGAINAFNDERFPHFRQVLEDAGFRTEAVLLQPDLVREIRPVLYLLWGGVLFVLLIGAVNITNLAFVRSSARQRELATRHAVGAGIGRLATQLITETMLLAAAGGVAGVLLGRWALALVPSLGLDEMPRGHEIRMEPATIAIILGLSLAVGFLVSLVPVVRVWRLNLNLALRDEGRGGTASRRSMMARHALATAQVGFAFLLLIGAGLLFASFRHVLGVDPGFTADGVISGAINLPGARYPDGGATRSFQQRALERVRAIPGIERASLIDTLPFSGDSSDSVILAEGYVMKPGESLISPFQNNVAEGYFETLKIRLMSGRYFDGRDTGDSPSAIIVDRKLAERFWPGRDSVGRRMFTIARPGSSQDITKPGPDSRWFTVVGVVDDVKVLGLAEEDKRVGAYYFPLTQQQVSSFSIVARTALDADTAAGAIRREIAAVDPEVPFYNVRMMSERIDESLTNRRMPMLLAMAFGIVALFLSAIGIYGVLAYQVAQRRREIGIRMALGSSVRAVFGLVLADGAKIVAVGLALGLAGAMVMGSYIESQLFGVDALDPMVIGAVGLVLAIVSFVAVTIPARRAARVNPVSALAGE
ncbi:MAG TPA: ABC transporter permease [Vicinamibacterales bacterium]|nr:ABC transporter permease [Vicinamibacterales bacterium]